MIRRIVTSPHPALRIVAKEATEINEQIKTIAQDLEDTLEVNIRKAVGLSANQINERYRIIAFIDIETRKIESIINPKIIYYSKDDLVLGKESCLSYPGVSKYITRPREIIVEGYSKMGNPVKYSMTDYQARIVCHEVDHLFGKCKVGISK